MLGGTSHDVRDDDFQSVYDESDVEADDDVDDSGGAPHLNPARRRRRALRHMQQCRLLRAVLLKIGNKQKNVILVFYFPIIYF